MDDLRCQVLTLNPEIIICTETWLNSNTPSEAVDVYGYDIFRSDRIDESGRGGVAIWTKSYLRVTKLPFPVFNKTEMCCVQIQSMKLLVIGIYLPPGMTSSVFHSICDSFIRTVDNLLIAFPHHRLIVAGDFNRYDRSFLTTNFSLKNVVNGPTRLNSSLDQIFTDRCIYDCYGSDDVEIGAPIGGSDHCTVFVRPRNSNRGKCNVRRQVFYDLRLSNLLAFERRFLANDLQSFYCSHDIDRKCELFYQFMKDALQAIPTHAVYFTNADAPWITSMIKHLINQRWEAFRARNWTRYYSLKAKVKKEILKAKKNYFRKKSESVKGLWSYVRMERGGTTKSTPFDLRAVGLSLRDQLNNLNDHYCSVMNSRTASQSPLKLKDDSWMPSFRVEDVWRALTKLSAKATGSDNIPTLLYKKCALILADPIYHLISECLRQRQFPSLWKIADVIPVPKSSESSVSNTRPISLLPVPSKIAEKLILMNMKPNLTSRLGSN